MALLVLMIANFFAYLIGCGIAKVINYVARRNIIKGGIFGTLLVIGLSCFLSIASLNKLPPNSSPAGNIQQFEQGLTEGSVIGDSIIPGILVLAGIAIYARYRQKPPSSKYKSNSNAKLQDQIATIIFWLVGGGFLVLVIAALAFGS